MFKKWLTGIMLVLAVAAAVMIFCLSAQSADESHLTSINVTELMLRIFVPDYPNLPRKEQQRLMNMYEAITRKIAHALEFMVFSACLFLALHGLRARPAPLWTVLGGVFYACTDEAHQMLVDGRGPALLDVGIDSGGVVVGLLLGLLLLAIFHRFWPARET